MWKFLLGPLLLGATYIGGSIYGSDSEQLVRKSPSDTYAAAEQAIDGAEQSGTIDLEGGKQIPYELKVDRALDQRLDLALMMDGKKGAQVAVTFTPQDGGQATLITARVHADHAVLRETLAGTEKARLAYAPDWLLNITLRPVLQKLAEQIERGETVGDPMHGFQSQADWEASLPPDKQKQIQEWRQYDASRPMVDPNEAARNYLKGSH